MVRWVIILSVDKPRQNQHSIKQSFPVAVGIKIYNRNYLAESFRIRIMLPDWTEYPGWSVLIVVNSCLHNRAAFRTGAETDLLTLFYSALPTVRH